MRYFNTRYARSGTLWEGRYKASVIDSATYLLTCYRYIELNPCRAGMVSDPGDYPWSSYRGNAGLQHDPLLTPHEEYRELGCSERARSDCYRDMLSEGLGEAALSAIRKASGKNAALGNDRFTTDIEARLKQRVRPAPVGRPPKRRV